MSGLTPQLDAAGGSAHGAVRTPPRLTWLVGGAPGASLVRRRPAARAILTVLPQTLTAFGAMGAILLGSNALGALLITSDGMSCGGTL